MKNVVFLFVILSCWVAMAEGVATSDSERPLETKAPHKSDASKKSISIEERAMPSRSEISKSGLCRIDKSRVKRGDFPVGTFIVRKKAHPNYGHIDLGKTPSEDSYKSDFKKGPDSSWLEDIEAAFAPCNELK